MALVTIERVVVINTGGEGANLRVEPSRTSPPINVLLDGDELEIIGPDREQEGITWRNVRDRLGNVGWVAAGFVGPPGSQSVAKPAVTPGTPSTRVATTAAKPTVPATTGTAPAKPTVATKPTQPPATAAPSTGPVAVSANVARPVISAGSQGLHVRVTQGGAPVAGARVVAVIQDRGATRTLDLGSTDSSGVATRSFDVGTPQGAVTINVTVTTADGRTGSAATSFTSS